MVAGCSLDLVAHVEVIERALDWNSSWEVYSGADGMANRHGLNPGEHWEPGAWEHRKVGRIELYDLHQADGKRSIERRHE